jgi:hypothetical protein
MPPGATLGDTTQRVSQREVQMKDHEIRAFFLLHTYSIKAIWVQQIRLLKEKPQEYLDRVEKQLLEAAPADKQPEFRAAYLRQVHALAADLRDMFETSSSSQRSS